MRLSIQEIQYVQVVAETGSITKAASSLYVSQPALSQAIMKIEANLGVSLFTRNKKAFSLTPEGEYFVKKASEIMHYINLIDDAVNKQLQATSEELRIGIPHYLGSKIIPPILKLYRNKYPDIRIILSEDSSMNLESQLLECNIDLAVFPLPIQAPNIAYTPLFECPLGLLMSAKSPLVEKCHTDENSNLIIDLENIKDINFISTNDMYGQRTAVVFNQVLKSAGIYNPPAFVSKNFNTIMRMVANGLGVSLIPKAYINNEEMQDLDLVIASLPDNQAYTWTVVAAYNKTNSFTRPAKDFLDIMKQHFYHSEQKDLI